MKAKKSIPLILAWNNEDHFAGAFSNPFQVTPGPFTPPALTAPSDLKIELISDGFEITWGGVDGANDYRLFRSKSPTGPFDTAVYWDAGEGFQDSYDHVTNSQGVLKATNLRHDTTYCYVVAASNAGGISANSDIACKTTAPDPNAPQVGAALFDFPFSDNPDGEPYCDGGQASGCWFDVQDFRTLREDLDNKRHLGEDWNFGLGDDDLYETIYSIGDGTVEFVGDVVEGIVDAWEGIVVIRHDAPAGSHFLLPDETPDTTSDNETVTTVYSFYGHLDADNLRVGNGDEVSRREPVGRIGNTPLTSTGPHLHWEIWVPGNPNIGTDWRGPGYAIDTTGWIDPTDFVRLNRAQPGPEPLIDLGGLGIDRWWGTAGGEPFPVTWTVHAPNAADYRIEISGLRTIPVSNTHWSLIDQPTGLVQTENASYPVTDIICLPNEDTCNVFVSLEAGTNSISISDFVPPQNVGISEITFKLIDSSGDVEDISTRFIADYAEMFQQQFPGLDVTVDGSEFSIASTQQLIETFAPILQLDSRDAFSGPFSVREILANAVRTNEIGQLRAGDVNNYLDLSSFANLSAQTPSPSTFYASLLTDTNDWSTATAIAITYHFAYPRSNWADYGGLNTHEGDWESATLFLEETDSGNWAPTELAAAQHVRIPVLSDGGDRYRYADLARSGIRPHVFVGLGGHASFGFPGERNWGILSGIEVHQVDKTPVTNASVIQLPRVGDLESDSVFNWLVLPDRWGQPDLFNQIIVGDDGPPGPVFGDAWFDAFDRLDNWNLDSGAFRFDFGVALATAPRFRSVATGSDYERSVGFGWQHDTTMRDTIVVLKNKGALPDLLLSDGVKTSNETFLVDIPNGLYDVTLTLGSTNSTSYEAMNVLVEEAAMQVDAVGDQIVVRTLTNVRVTDGQMTVTFNDRSESGDGFPVLSLEIAPALDHDGANEASSAVPLDQSVARATIEMSGVINTPGDVDWFSFNAIAGHNYDLSTVLDGIDDTIIALHDSTGQQLAWNDDAESIPLDRSSSIQGWQATTTGRYYVSVDGYGTEVGNYLLRLVDRDFSCSSDCLTIEGRIEDSDGTTHLITFAHYDAQNLVPIDPAKETWIVIHGLDSSANADWVGELSRAIDDHYPNDQVLTLDWETAADGILSEFRIPIVGSRAADLLNEFGINASNINVMGHSWGSYVGDELAETLEILQLREIKSIVALDPAEDVPFGYNPDLDSVVNFGEHAEFSWAFYADGFDLGVLGSEDSPRTAHEAFVAEDTAHFNIHEAFTNILTGNVSGSVINDLFHLDRLTGRDSRSAPWYHDRFDENGRPRTSLTDQSTTHFEVVIDFDDLVPSTYSYYPVGTSSFTIQDFWTTLNQDTTELRGSVVADGLIQPIVFERADGSDDAIVPETRTWVVIHGRNGNADEQIYQDIASEISAYYPSDQVLTLDWNTLAQDNWIGLFFAGNESFLEAVGEEAAKVLQLAGFSGSNINLVGYSWGGIVAGELAEEVRDLQMGVVNTITAIDVAENIGLIFGSYNPDNQSELNYRANSQFSWAFHAPGIAGSEHSPATAHEAFLVPGSNHSLIIDQFLDLLRANRTANANAQLHLDRLLAHGPNPIWEFNRFKPDTINSRAFEVEIRFGDSGPLSLTYIPENESDSVSIPYSAPDLNAVDDAYEFAVLITNVAESNRSVLANDQGPVTSVKIVSDATQGDLRLDESGDFSYQPNQPIAFSPGFSDSFVYAIEDEFGRKSSAVVQIRGNFAFPSTNATEPTGKDPSSPWTNPNERFDVNEDDTISARDALNVINWIGQKGGGLLPDQREADEFWVDVNNSKSVSALDALQVINELARLVVARPEGELIQAPLPQPSSSVRTSRLEEARSPEVALAPISVTSKIADTQSINAINVDVVINGVTNWDRESARSIEHSHEPTWTFDSDPIDLANIQ